ncbi:uncharacterized protein A4U43_UnF2150 [Asparagus officinalis]|uniref:Protein PAIR1 n=1 Tax=Asparagus officinalis TaxID=4686 RepID=A0A1R3L7C7_ASPOF|nr:protein PAIR1 isoform X2 [Asparagus officinalis]ONK55513.1 uncharacterized protein A4U43_UnF2150 [Asparagus officinalis]
MNPMKMKINKACDLNSISVLPPHSRRSNTMSQASQIRSQSQQSFSQGTSLSQSQLSQSSFDENLMNDQRFNSQERANPSKRISSLASGMATRDESQLQLARTSNNVTRRWGTASVPDNRCQVNEELENKFRQTESSLSRITMILDSVQNDVMQVNRAVKEVSMETEGIRQKIILLDNSMRHVVKADEGLKAFLDAKLKSIPDQVVESNQSKLNEIASMISDLPKQMESHLVKFQRELCMFVAEKTEVIGNSKKFYNDSFLENLQSPKSKCYIAARQPQKNQIPIPVLPPFGHTRRVSAPKMEADIPKTLKPKVTGSNRNVMLKREEIPILPKEKDFSVTIDSDEESDVGLSCLLVQKETGKASHLVEEAKEETLRILRKARKRKRRQSNCVILD